MVAEDATPVADQPDDEASTEPTRFGDWEITVTSTELSQGFATYSEQKPPRGVYVVIALTLTNMGLAPNTFPYDDLILVDGAGRSFSLDSEGTIYWQSGNNDLSLYSDLQPGLSYDAAILFDGPADATNLVLSDTQGMIAIDLAVE